MSQIGIIGCGRVGSAIVQGLTSSGRVSSQDIWASTHTEESRQEAEARLKIPLALGTPEERIKNTRNLILAVKPSQAREVLAQIRSFISSDTVLISVVTGLTTSDIDKALGSSIPVIRVVPNTACFVQKGVIVVAAGPGVSPEQRERADLVFQPLGTVIHLDESMCDFVTSVSASGLAFLYTIIESFTEGGVRLGLPREVALRMAALSMIGAGEMVLSSGKHPASLRDDVTTPGGCTIEGLLVLEDGRIRSTISMAIEKAAQVAKRLGEK